MINNNYNDYIIILHVHVLVRKITSIQLWQKLANGKITHYADKVIEPMYSTCHGHWQSNHYSEERVINHDCAPS